MFNWFRKEKWAQLKTVTLSGISWGADTPSAKTGGSIYIHLFESDKGNRKIDVACSFVGVPDENTLRYVKGIPRYSDIPEEDTANALKGKID
jgi:hypothetical protein